jgi:hypothetical protein
VGGLAAYRAVARRKPAPAVQLEPAAAAAPVDRAEELRAKLAEARAEPPEPAGPDDRRQAVRDQAKAALDEMQGGDS